MIRRRRMFESEAFDNKVAGIRDAQIKRLRRKIRKETEMASEATAKEDRLVRLSCIKLDKIYEILKRVVKQVVEASDVVGGNLDFKIAGDYGVMNFDGYIAHAWSDVLPDTGSEDDIQILANYRLSSSELELCYTINGDIDLGNFVYVYDGNEPDLDGLTSFVEHVYDNGEVDGITLFNLFNEALNQIIKRAEKLEAETEEKLIKVIDDYERKEIRGLKESRRSRGRMLKEGGLLGNYWSPDSDYDDPYVQAYGHEYECVACGRVFRGIEGVCKNEIGRIFCKDCWDKLYGDEEKNK